MQISVLKKKENGSTPHGMLPWKNESQQRTESKNLQERTNTSLSMTNNLLGLLAKELKKPVTMYRMWQSVQGQNLILQIAIHHCVQGSSWVLLFLGSDRCQKKHAPVTYAVLGNPRKICWSEVRAQGSLATPIVWVICSRNCLQKSGLHYQQSLHRYSWMKCKWAFKKM